MKKYKVIRQCFDYGRLCELGEVFELDGTPSHHFQKIGDDAVVTAKIKNAKIDPMKPRNIGGGNSFAEMANADVGPQGGMAAGMNSNKAVTHVRDLKKPAEIKKQPISEEI